MVNVSDPFDGVGIKIDAFLADSAQVSDGKISALGLGWGVLNVSDLPVIHPVLSLAMMVHVPYSDTDVEHDLNIQLHDQDGAPQPMSLFQTPDGQIGAAMDLNAKFKVDRIPGAPVGDDINMPLVIPVQNLRFEKEGMYSWVISVNTVPVNRIPLRVSVIPQQ